jgi:hypothetical protein
MLKCLRTIRMKELQWHEEQDCFPQQDPGLPDGIFLYQKSRYCDILRGLGSLERYYVWYILVIVKNILGIFSISVIHTFWYIGTKNLATQSKTPTTIFVWREIGSFENIDVRYCVHSGPTVASDWIMLG